MYPSENNHPLKQVINTGKSLTTGQLLQYHEYSRMCEIHDQMISRFASKQQTKRKKRKLDFIIKDSDTSRLIFRFYPRGSSCHSFTDEPPKSWKDVFKVYYSYAILQQSRLTKDDMWETQVVFTETCDECSIIDEVGERCKLLSEGTETLIRQEGEEIRLLDDIIFPFGMGTNWTISKFTVQDSNDDEAENIYRFTLFDYFNIGFRFELDEHQLKPFGQYLLDCCEYMLQHGEGI